MGETVMGTTESVAPNLFVETIAPSREEHRLLSRQRFKTLMAFCEPAADFFAAAAGMFTACVLTSTSISIRTQFLPHESVAISIATGLLVTLLMRADGAYRGGGGLLRIRETERAIRSASLSLLFLLVAGFLLSLDIAPAAFFIALVTVPFLLALQKQSFLFLVRMLHLRERGVDRVVVYGAGTAGRSVVSALLHSPRLGYHPVAVIENDPALAGRPIFAMGYRGGRSVPVQCGPVTASLLKSLRCGRLMVAAANLCPEDLSVATRAAMQAGANVTFLYEATPNLPPDTTQESRWTQSINLDGLLLTCSTKPALPWHYALAKRGVDLAVSSLLLVLSAPLLLLIALLVCLDSPGPALFVQKRVGRNGRLFDIYKFRTMHAGAPRYEPSPASSADPRITRIGRFLRRASLDELPQFLNVFLGNMSLVGPRPEMPFIVRQYDSRQRRRIQATPGITGLWQLSADRVHPIHQNIDYDLYYICNRTFFMDIAILLHTAFFAMRGGI